MTLLEQDEANRRRALDLDSFIVEAPAGAGKTELLTQRYLRLLATVEEPEEIVAITFTNKAAGEMRERIAESLALAREGRLPEASHKQVTFRLATAALQRAAERDWQLETQPGRLRLTTIDAFCASLARQMPYLSRFGAQPAVAEDAQRHYDEAARRAIDHLEEAGELGDAVALALSHLDNDTDRLARLLAQMLARREQWTDIASLDHPESAIVDSLHALVAEELGRIADGFGGPWWAVLRPLIRWESAPAADVAALPRWRELADALLTKEGEPRKRLTKNEGFPPEDKARKEAMLAFLGGLGEAEVAALRRLRELPQPAGDDDAIVRALVRLLKLAAAELWLVFRERGEVDFGELASRAIAALGDETSPSELALRLDYRIRHLLVDEFQDTSPAQIDLLARLTAGWSGGDGRTLFAVGDPMQSIYRFRKADVGLFLQVAERGIGSGEGGLRLTPLRLSRNNRSHPAVVDWINAHFPQVFPPTDAALRGEIAYRDFVATREAAGDDGVFVRPVFDDGDEPAAVIDLIAAEWAADPQRRIAVLARAKDHLTPLVATLRRQRPEWRFSAVEIEPLVGRQVVQDLIALTRALHHRADRLHWLAVLRAPWCGLRLADLHALAGDDHAATIVSLMSDEARVARLSADGQTRLAHVRAVMAEALAGEGRQSRRRWVEDAWRRLGGPRCTDARGREDATAFFRRLDALDAAGRFDLDGLEDDMGRLFAAADGAADGRLQLMTIHKSKGLEFDTVILPGLHRTSGGDDRLLLAWGAFPLADGERLVAAPVNRRRGKARGEEGPTAYDYLLRLERERSANEEARVLYVAATRAVRRLHLLGVARRKEGKEEGGLAAPRAGSSLARLWPAVEAAFVEAAAVSPAPTLAAWADEGDGYSHFVPRLLRLPAPALPAEGPTPAFAPPPLPLRDELMSGTDAALAAAVGTLVHAVLDQIAADPEAWSPDRARAGQAAYARWLASRGWPAAQAEAGAARAAALLATTLASEAGRWALRRREAGGSELALSRIGADDAVSTRVVDRSFIEDGARWIIDWKTADPGASSANLAASLATHAERYRAQLESYAALFVGEGLPIRLGVFYVAHGVLVRLDYNPPTV